MPGLRFYRHESSDPSCRELPDDEILTMSIRMVARLESARDASDEAQSTAEIADQPEHGRRSADPLIRNLLDEMYEVAVRLDQAALWALWAQAVYNLADDLKLRDPAAARAWLALIHETAKRRNEPILWHLYDKTRAVLDVIPAGKVLFEDEYDLPMPTLLSDTDLPIWLMVDDSGKWRRAKRWQTGSGGYQTRNIAGGEQDVERPYLPREPEFLSPVGVMPGDLSEERAIGKTGRNDPCPCGSGRKYKHCHGRLA
jgi:hypothetical protein